MVTKDYTPRFNAETTAPDLSGPRHTFEGVGSLWGSAGRRRATGLAGCGPSGPAKRFVLLMIGRHGAYPAPCGPSAAHTRLIPSVPTEPARRRPCRGGCTIR